MSPAASVSPDARAQLTALAQAAASAQAPGGSVASGPDADFVPEPGVTVEYVRPDAILDLIRDGSFCQAHHIAAWFLAAAGGPARG